MEEEELMAPLFKSSNQNIERFYKKQIRRGFGSVVTREISYRLAAQGHDVMALVGHSNKPSSGMFSKLGFQIIDQCLWLRTEPTKGDGTWPEGE